MAHKEYKVIWTKAALLDLEAIYHYISQEVSENKALQVIDEIYIQTSILTEFPKAFKKDIYYTKVDFRFLLVYNYKVYYKIAKGVVLIAQVKHAKQDLGDI